MRLLKGRRSPIWICLMATSHCKSLLRTCGVQTLQADHAATGLHSLEFVFNRDVSHSIWILGSSSQIFTLHYASTCFHPFLVMLLLDIQFGRHQVGIFAAPLQGVCCPACCTTKGWQGRIRLPDSWQQWTGTALWLKPKASVSKHGTDSLLGVWEGRG